MTSTKLHAVKKKQNTADNISLKTMDRREFLKYLSLTCGALISGFKPSVAKAIIPFGFIKKTISTLTYADDVFATYLYTGNGSTQTINNGIDLLGKGGMVWIKSRSASASPVNNFLQDSVQYMNSMPWYSLKSDTNEARWMSGSVVIDFTSTGYKVGGAYLGISGAGYASWTFRKSSKFFDVVTWTGASNQTINHSLGVAPGMILVKRLNAAENWYVYHRGLPNTDPVNCDILKLNLTDAYSPGNGVFGNVTASSFLVRLNSTTSPDGYIAYIFAHDTSLTGIINCGVVDKSVSSVANLGWEPQWLLYKQYDSTGNWFIMDTMRGLNIQQGDLALSPNLTNAEPTASSNFSITSTGFNASGIGGSTTKWIYTAIRLPNKPPTTGTQVYTAVTRTGTGAAVSLTGVGFAPDLVIGKSRSNASRANGFIDKLRGSSRTLTASTNAEFTSDNAITTFDNDGYTLGADSAATGSFNTSGESIVHWIFRRAPGVLDIVSYRGDGTGNVVRNHNLGAIPEMVIIKPRTGSASLGYSWIAYHSSIGLGNGVCMANTDPIQPYWNTLDSEGTATSFTPKANAYLNISGDTYIAYLFASKTGVSKVGSYNGVAAGAVTVPCGFTGSARFVLIKRTDAAGDWIVVDSARGSGVYMKLNGAASEVSTSVITFTTGGFTTAAAGAVTRV